MSDQEILRQRHLLDALLASRITPHEHQQQMDLMDSIYFKKNLPENVVLFPMNRIKRYVHKTTREPGKKNT
jgi:hypothetical protein